jgi:transposase-like protein
VIKASDGRTQRRFSPAKDARMVEMATGGAKVRQICEELGRAPTSIKIRLMTLALHDEQLA